MRSIFAISTIWCFNCWTIFYLWLSLLSDWCFSSSFSFIRVFFPSQHLCNTQSSRKLDKKLSWQMIWMSLHVSVLFIKESSQIDSGISVSISKDFIFKILLVWILDTDIPEIVWRRKSQKELSKRIICLQSTTNNCT